MREKTIGWIIYLGISQRFLQDAATRQIKGDGYLIYNIDRFLIRLDELGLTVTRSGLHPVPKTPS
jgi:hypothetical protein